MEKSEQKILYKGCLKWGQKSIKKVCKTTFNKTQKFLGGVLYLP